MKEESLLLLSDLQKLINQVVLIDYTIIILGSDWMAISNILKDIRVERNLIQEDLAEATGSYQPKMKEFSGATPVSVEQEFYINMLYSNLCAIVKNDADEKIAASSRPDNEYQYQANRSYIIGRLKYLVIRLLC